MSSLITGVSFADQLSVPFDAPYSNGNTIVTKTISGSTSSSYTGAYTATPVSGYEGNAFSFTAGSNVTISDANALDIGTEDLKISFMIKTTDSHGTVMDKRQSSSTNGYHVMVYNGTILLQIADNDWGWYNYYPKYPGSDAKVDDGQWHSVVIHVDRDQTDGGKLFVDGNLVHVYDATRHQYGSLANSSSMHIGKHSFGSSSLEGQLDNFAVGTGADAALDDYFVIDAAADETATFKLEAGKTVTVVSDTWPGKDNIYWNPNIQLELTPNGGSTLPAMSIDVNGTVQSVSGGTWFEFVDIADNGPYTIKIDGNSNGNDINLKINNQ